MAHHMYPNFMKRENLSACRKFESIQCNKMLERKYYDLPQQFIIQISLKVIIKGQNMDFV